MFFAVAGLPRDRRNFDGTPSDEAVVHALPVVVIVDDNPGWGCQLACLMSLSDIHLTCCFATKPRGHGTGDA